MQTHANEHLRESDVDPLAPLLQLVQLGALACVAWLGVLGLLSAAARVPGALGRRARRLARRLAPVALHAALGLTVGGLGMSATATAAERPAPPAVSLDWPGTTAGTVATPPASAKAVPAATPAPSAAGTAGPSSAAAPPTPPAPGTSLPSPAPARPAPTGGGTTVVVRAGDSLWALAAQDLGADATPDRVAQAWPRWWAANRDVIGDDPDLIHPGTVLDRPDRPQESS